MLHYFLLLEFHIFCVIEIGYLNQLIFLLKNFQPIKINKKITQLQRLLW